MINPALQADCADLIKKLENGHQISGEGGGGGLLFRWVKNNGYHFAEQSLAEPSILILDEATSSIDSESEKGNSGCDRYAIKG